MFLSFRVSKIATSHFESDNELSTRRYICGVGTIESVVNPRRTRPASIAAIPALARLFRFMIRHLLEQYNEYQILRSWSNRSRLSRRQAMAQTPTAATRAEINSASLNHAYKGQWRLYKMIGLDV